MRHEGSQWSGPLVLYTTFMYDIRSSFAFAATDGENCAAIFKVTESGNIYPVEERKT
jgi:hypothetical protein